MDANVVRSGMGMVFIRHRRDGRVGALYLGGQEFLSDLMDCRPIDVRSVLKVAGFSIKETDVENMWVAVEIVLAAKDGSA